MHKLTPVYYTHVRLANEEEKIKLWYLVKDGTLSIAQVAYTKLENSSTITLDEAQGKYEQLLAKVGLKEGEEIKSVKFDLTPYFEYNDQGIPVLGSEENPYSHEKGEEKTATYNARINRLIIWECGEPVYENYNGRITIDRDALADTYL